MCLHDPRSLGINLGPGTTTDTLNDDHWWFLDWEEKGDYPLRYFIEPVLVPIAFVWRQPNLVGICLLPCNSLPHLVHARFIEANVSQPSAC